MMNGFKFSPIILPSSRGHSLEYQFLPGSRLIGVIILSQAIHKT
jgi:hypothetical protein